MNGRKNRVCCNDPNLLADRIVIGLLLYLKSGDTKLFIYMYIEYFDKPSAWEKHGMPTDQQSLRSCANEKQQKEATGRYW